ncbi:hypothetical protein P8C59_008667 [Phyllachora maydis]|uniref:DUF1275 domain protein n=1 Tax=Phyllachora maydis TaxID=1825666 RepID=A0AAD9MH61_9PEZI|nr:hypothetical protein P8C59_008667 [Phyllachora maydis]
MPSQAARDRAVGHGQPDEELPLLRDRQRNIGLVTRARRHFMQDVSRSRADVVLLFCYTITGLLDASSVSIWGAFVSMQTGNTVYIGLGLAAPSESTRWIKSLTSLASFCAGSFLFSSLHGRFSPAQRWVVCASSLVQALLILGAAVTVTLLPKPGVGDEIGWHVLVPIALVALQSCGQAVTSRALKYNSLTSVVLTSIYCDLFSDAKLFALDNVDRNRRLSAPVLLVLGAFSGAAMEVDVRNKGRARGLDSLGFSP